ncbi:nucleotidyltransferase family protein [Amaricoccus solimangrovi]|uniref:Nucleotidyltransferase family protein n=1 Tax=Amaricoccus solimangrovi TaxID=2589815 RepID=A0A501WGY3_9RHOB|nr:nucleotidyltransferase family protein [Amaricoccus solimangrovi]TPE49143.1 nucleotidyltransferase family protein [Amaricoccus solimangrovi]
MKSRAGTLDMLLAALDGRPPPATDWDAVIALANRSLLTPTLCQALRRAGALDGLPADAADFLAFIDARNLERNRRLRAQLGAVIAALNRRGITPVLLKGAAPLYAAPERCPPARITSDLDIGVPAARLRMARAALRRIGYAALPGAREMARTGDPGVVDLRASAASGTEVARGPLRAIVPSPEARALHWILHDLLKEGDYWRGRIDLRHLRDLAELAAAEPVDWGAVRAAGADRATRNAIDTQLVTLADLFGTRVPAESRHLLTRLQHARRLFTARYRVIGAPLRLAGQIAWIAHRTRRADDLMARGPGDLLRRAVRVFGESRAKL